MTFLEATASMFKESNCPGIVDAMGRYMALYSDDWPFVIEQSPRQSIYLSGIYFLNATEERLAASGATIILDNREAKSASRIGDDKHPYEKFVNCSDIYRATLENDSQCLIVVGKVFDKDVFNKLASILPIVWPEKFPPNFAAEHAEALKKLSLGNESEMWQFLNQQVKWVNEFKAKNIRNVVNARVNSGKNRIVNDLNRQLSERRVRLNTLYQQLNDTISEIRDMEMELQGFYLIGDQIATDELIQWIVNHPNIQITDDGNDTTVRIVDTLEYYDEDLLSNLLDNPRALLHNITSDFKAFITRVFINHEADFEVTSMWYWKSAGEAIPYDRTYGLSGHGPAPHLYFYRCLGGNGAPLAKAAERGDTEIMFEQMISATKNINWNDAAVVEKFVGWIESHVNTKCIIKDGNHMTIKEFMNGQS